MINSHELIWSPHSDGFALHLRRRGRALLYVVPDTTHPQMWRVRFLDGSVSDMVNKTRAMDAGRQLALADLKKDTGQTGVEARVAAPSVSPAMTLANDETVA